MILRIASSRIVGQGDIVGRSGYFSLNLSANSVMRGRLDARRTLKSLVADLREILKRAECIFIEQWKILYKEDEIDMEDIFSIFYKGSNNCEIQVKKLIIKNIDSVVCNRVETA